MNITEYYNPDVSSDRFNMAEKNANTYIKETSLLDAEISSQRYIFRPEKENPIGRNAYFRKIFFTLKNNGSATKKISFGFLPEGWKIFTDNQGVYHKHYQTVTEIFNNIIKLSEEFKQSKI